MAWNKKKRWSSLLIVVMILSSCSISYKFNGASINYDKIKTIQISDFPLRTALVWAPMYSIYNNRLKDIYANQTRLQQVKKRGDLQLSGEIVGYDQYNKGISADGFSSQVQLKMTVNVRFVNTKNHKQDFEKQFSAVREYDSSQQFNSVQEDLVTEIVRDICDQIFNATVAQW